MSADNILRICQQLVKIDNRGHKDLARSMGVTAPTVRRLRNGADLHWVRSTTVAGLIRACHKEFVLRPRK